MSNDNEQYFALLMDIHSKASIAAEKMPHIEKRMDELEKRQGELSLKLARWGGIVTTVLFLVALFGDRISKAVFAAQ